MSRHILCQMQQPPNCCVCAGRRVEEFCRLCLLRQGYEDVCDAPCPPAQMKFDRAPRSGPVTRAYHCDDQSLPLVAGKTASWLPLPSADSGVMTGLICYRVCRSESCVLSLFFKDSKTGELCLSCDLEAQTGLRCISVDILDRWGHFTRVSVWVTIFRSAIVWYPSAYLQQITGLQMPPIRLNHTAGHCCNCSLDLRSAERWICRVCGPVFRLCAKCQKKHSAIVRGSVLQMQESQSGLQIVVVSIQMTC